MADTLVGYSIDDLRFALDTMESSINPGEWCQLQFCTESMPTRETLDKMYLDILLTGHHITQPIAEFVSGIPTTTFNIRRDLPYPQFQWQLIIPLIVPILIIGLIAFSIVKIESIAAALVKLIAVAGGVAIVLAIIIRAPSRRELARIRELERSREKAALVPATSKKEEKLWYLGEYWEKEYSSATGDVYRSADGKKRLYAYWDGSKKVVPVEASTPKKALAASLR